MKLIRSFTFVAASFRTPSAPQAAHLRGVDNIGEVAVAVGRRRGWRWFFGGSVVRLFGSCFGGWAT